MPQTGRLAGLIATYDNDGSGVHFHLKDWLGTRRMQTNYAGTPEDAWTGLPFGNGLTQTYGTVNDGTEPHYTGKERDQESGFDDFGPRYYASSRGRFMSPDPSGLHRADLPECRLRFGDTNRSIQH
jgi:RHS repeat-associated protein